MENKRIKTGGRKKKNQLGRKITFTPTDEVLNIYTNWEKPVETLEKAILLYESTFRQK